MAELGLDQLEVAWRFSDELFQNHITAARALCQPISLRNPFVFYLGHLPALSWNMIRASPSPSLPPIHAYFESLFSRGIDPDVEDPSQCHEHLEPTLEWPSWDSVLEYQQRVREAIRAAVTEENPPSPRVLRLVAEHEVMHVETMYYMLAQKMLPTTPCCKPTDRLVICTEESTSVRKKTLPKVDWIDVESGRVQMGDPSPAGFVWDNETSAETVEVSAFRISKYAVSINDFVGFIRVGGYRRRSLWTADDWDWVVREGLRHPSSWSCDGSGQYSVLTGLGPGTVEHKVRVVEEVGSWPVSVSLAEARAYAVWVGASLPCEAQWMLAAYGPSGGMAEVSGRDVMSGVPRDVREGETAACGVVGMVGNGWELTTGVFDEFEGFMPMAEYPEYSASFFDGKHFVLKGASWATHSFLVRPSFRNFFQARYPFVFSKFRLVTAG